MKALSSIHCLTCDAFPGNIFRHLSPELTRLLDQKKITRSYKKKQTVFFEGNPCQGIYCVKSGRIKLYKTGAEGRPYILKIAGPKDVLALESLFSGQEYFPSAEVLEDAILCYIPKEVMFEIIRQDPSAAREVTNLLTRMIKESEDERVELAQQAVRTRLARLLTLLAKSHGKKGPKGLLIDLKLSREELAEMIGTAQETAIRLLGNFKEKHLVEIKGKNITILNETELTKIAQFL